MCDKEEYRERGLDEVFEELPPDEMNLDETRHPRAHYASHDAMDGGADETDAGSCFVFVPHFEITEFSFVFIPKEVGETLEDSIVFAAALHAQAPEVSFPLAHNIVLCGPDGCGKRTAVLQICRGAQVNAVILDCSLASAADVSRAVRFAHNHSPCAVLFDKCTGVLTDDVEPSPFVVATWREMNKLRSDTYKGKLVWNIFLWENNLAFFSRHLPQRDEVLLFPVPDEKDIGKLFDKFYRRMFGASYNSSVSLANRIGEDAFRSLIQYARGCTPRMINIYMMRVHRAAIRSSWKSILKSGARNGSGKRVIPDDIVKLALPEKIHFWEKIMPLDDKNFTISDIDPRLISYVYDKSAVPAKNYTRNAHHKGLVYME